MYEIFILGKLMHRPLHGYVLQSIMNAAWGPFRRLSWGTLYPLLRRLEQGGLIAVQRGNSEDGRGTKTYRTTSCGRARFFELMRAKLSHHTDARDLFRVKLSNFGHIETADQRLILADYRAHLAAIVAHSEAKSLEVLKAPGLAPAERPYVLQAIDHQRHLAASEIAWLDALIEKTGGKNYDEGKNTRGDNLPHGSENRRQRARSGSHSRQ